MVAPGARGHSPPAPWGRAQRCKAWSRHSGSHSPSPTEADKTTSCRRLPPTLRPDTLGTYDVKGEQAELSGLTHNSGEKVRERR